LAVDICVELVMGRSLALVLERSLEALFLALAQ
jgi:hypothetical protein